ncbi:hypothetical protein GTA08_BOTSDO12683 [Botryosphaeria dothidea]|uniref:Uncharacterized protein n=1 Tax=Botryosphaeria dothidea TaxID=55169 RepID=A0A8H4J215_9PEZI|nr:hypothetical protein GTA08_BOTSDO12683 [Botryosphaeria dothidea]
MAFWLSWTYRHMRQEDAEVDQSNWLDSELATCHAADRGGGESLDLDRSSSFSSSVFWDGRIV